MQSKEDVIDNIEYSTEASVESSSVTDKSVNSDDKDKDQGIDELSFKSDENKLSSNFIEQLRKGALTSYNHVYLSPRVTPESRSFEDIEWLESHVFPDIEPSTLKGNTAESEGPWKNLLIAALMAVLTQVVVEGLTSAGKRPNGLEVDAQIDVPAEPEVLAGKVEIGDRYPFLSGAQQVKSDFSVGLDEPLPSNAIPDYLKRNEAVERQLPEDSWFTIDNDGIRAGKKTLRKAVMENLRDKVESYVSKNIKNLEYKEALETVSKTAKKARRAYKTHGEIPQHVPKESLEGLSKKQKLNKVENGAVSLHMKQAETRGAEKSVSAVKKIRTGAKIVSATLDPQGTVQSEAIGRSINSVANKFVAMKPEIFQRVGETLIRSSKWLTTGLSTLLTSDDLNPAYAEPREPDRQLSIGNPPSVTKAENIHSVDPILRSVERYSKFEQQKYPRIGPAAPAMRRELFIDDDLDFSLQASSAGQVVPLISLPFQLIRVALVSLVSLMPCVQSEPGTILLTAVIAPIVSYIISSSMGLFGQGGMASNNNVQQNLNTFLNILSNEFSTKVENILQHHFTQFEINQIISGVIATATHLTRYLNKDHRALRSATDAYVNNVYSPWVAFYGRVRRNTYNTETLKGMLDLLILIGSVNCFVGVISLEKDGTYRKVFETQIDNLTSHAAEIKEKLLAIQKNEIVIEKQSRAIVSSGKNKYLCVHCISLKLLGDEMTIKIPGRSASSARSPGFEIYENSSQNGKFWGVSKACQFNGNGYYEISYLHGSSQENCQDQSFDRLVEAFFQGHKKTLVDMRSEQLKNYFERGEEGVSDKKKLFSAPSKRPYLITNLSGVINIALGSIPQGRLGGSINKQVENWNSIIKNLDEAVKQYTNNKAQAAEALNEISQGQGSPGARRELSVDDNDGSWIFTSGAKKLLPLGYAQIIFLADSIQQGVSFYQFPLTPGQTCFFVENLNSNIMLSQVFCYWVIKISEFAQNLLSKAPHPELNYVEPAEKEAALEQLSQQLNGIKEQLLLAKTEYPFLAWKWAEIIVADHGDTIKAFAQPGKITLIALEALAQDLNMLAEELQQEVFDAKMGLTVVSTDLDKLREKILSLAPFHSAENRLSLHLCLIECYAAINEINKSLSKELVQIKMEKLKQKVARLMQKVEKRVEEPKQTWYEAFCTMFSPSSRIPIRFEQAKQQKSQTLVRDALSPIPQGPQYAQLAVPSGLRGISQ